MENTLIPEHVKEYEELLRKYSARDKTVNEATMQNFLEEHTAFIPTPFMLNHQLHFNSFISKFPVGHWFTDIAYLTKSTVEWWLVLIELENPNKSLFKGKLDHAEFTAEYMQAKQQIDDWKNYIEDHRDDVIEKLNRFRVPLPMQKNRISFKYVLVMGHRNEIQNSDARRRAIAGKNSNDFKIITYETILSDYQRIRRIPAESLVLSIYNGDRFKVKTLPKGKDGKSAFDGSVGRISTQLFRYLSFEDLSLTSEQIKEFEDDGYDMQSWLKGDLLTVNDKYTFDDFLKKFPENLMA